MKIAKFFAGIFAILGTLLMVGSLGLCLFSLNAKPKVESLPPEAAQCAQALADSLEAGDFAGASKLLYGQPDLGADRTPADPMGSMIWHAFQESISCELQGECSLEGTEIVQDVTVTVLDIPSVTEKLQTRAHALLTEKVEAATDMAELYGQDGQFHPELVEQVLYTALDQAIREDGERNSRTVRLTMIRREGQWWVVPGEGLLKILSGNLS